MCFIKQPSLVEIYDRHCALSDTVLVRASALGRERERERIRFRLTTTTEGENQLVVFFGSFGVNVIK